MKFKTYIFTVATLCLSLAIKAQVGVGILSADPSAALHVSSTSGGLLIPVLTQVQRDDVDNPAEGLLVYCSDCDVEGYYGYINTIWTPLQYGVEVNEMGLIMEAGFNTHGGTNNLQNLNSDFNTYYGNTAIGYLTLEDLEFGKRTTAVGYQVGAVLESGEDNIIIGNNTMVQAKEANNNVALGRNALANTNSSESNDNVAIGFWASPFNTVKGANVSVGAYSGYTSISDGNIALGYFAGQSDVQGSNHLFIESQGVPKTPLLGGDFSMDQIGINQHQDSIFKDGATLQIGGDIELLQGNIINEFSEDLNLTDNSQTAVPTEAATKTYVDNGFSGLLLSISNQEISTNPDFSGDSNDSIFAQSNAKSYIDNQMGGVMGTDNISINMQGALVSQDSVVSQKAVRSYLSAQLNDFQGLTSDIGSISEDVNFAGNSNDSISTQTAVKSYSDASLANIDVTHLLDIISADGSLQGDSHDTISTQKAVKTYVDNQNTVANLLSDLDTNLINSNSKMPTQKTVKTYVDALESDWYEGARLEQAVGTRNYHDGLLGFPSVAGSASDNIALGYFALNDLTTGSLNLAIGHSSLRENTAGNQNVAIGYNSAYYTGSPTIHGSGNSNTAFGNFALFKNTDGHLNTAIGAYSFGYSSVSPSVFTTYGDKNVVVGTAAGLDLSEGDGNVFLGRNAGRNTISSSNVFIGLDAGNDFSLPSDNFLIIENSTSGSPLLGGDFASQEVVINRHILSSGSAVLQIDGDASKSVAGSWSANSDKRLKKNIVYMDAKEELKKVLQLKGATYLWNDTATGIKRPTNIQYGFIAQDIQKIWPSKVKEDKLGYLETSYGDYDPMLVESIRAINSAIGIAQNENINLKIQIDNEQNRTLELKKAITAMIEKNKALKRELNRLEELDLKLKKFQALALQKVNSNVSASR